MISQDAFIYDRFLTVLARVKFNLITQHYQVRCIHEGINVCVWPAIVKPTAPKQSHIEHSSTVRTIMAANMNIITIYAEEKVFP